MAETWYYRVGAGAACGAGDRESLSETAGASVATKVMDATGDTWNRTEAAGRTIDAGNWQVSFRASSSSGPGPQPTMRTLVQRRNSSCVVQQTIIDESIQVPKGSTGTFTTAVVDPGAVVFAAGDILTIEQSKTGGTRVLTLRYDDVPADESFLTHPDETVVSSRRIFIIG